jgi:Protein of unknown function (DUF3489)
MSIKLTATQLVILRAAAQREDRCLTIPESPKGNLARKAFSKLLAAELVKEIRAKPGMPIWRRDEETAKSYSLKLTTSGTNAIAADKDSDGSATSNGSTAQPDLAVAEFANPSIPARATVLASAPREGTKMARIIGLLKRDHGATLAELIAATDWLPHTTRAALTGLRKRGFVVTLDRSSKERGSTYSIAPDQSVASEAVLTGAVETPVPAAYPTKVRHSTKAEPIALVAVNSAA